ncbi:hypothetical protein DFAR_180002 [Desulfarculales bacterium]
MSILAQAMDEVHMVYVIEGIRDYDHIYSDADPAFLKKFQNQEDPRAQAKVEVLCQVGMAGCPLITRRVRVGYPPREVLSLAKKIGASMIVMSTQGRSYNARHGGFLDSVSE